MSKTLLIMAGGTGGHIMPGLAVAKTMQQRGWNVVWLGHPERMEGRLVPPQHIPLEPLRFAGVRGKGLATLLKLPFTLTRAVCSARRSLKRIQPDVVLGMGGYVAFPGGVAAWLARIPLVVHEQNAVVGTANRWLAKLAKRSLVGFPGALRSAVVVGNPVREGFKQLPSPAQRFAARSGPLRVLVVGGSLGAAPLNRVVPRAVSQIPVAQRPYIIHQAGTQHAEAVRKQYHELGVAAECPAFIDDMAAAMGDADLVICRAGAMTVAEIAAAGVPALFVPLPHAIDDHQTANANYLTHCAAGWLQKQDDLSPEWLARWLVERNRGELAQVGAHAQEHAQLQATEKIADVCTQLAQRRAG